MIHCLFFEDYLSNRDTKDYIKMSQKVVVCSGYFGKCLLPKKSEIKTKTNPHMVSPPNHIQLCRPHPCCELECLDVVAGVGLTCLLAFLANRVMLNSKLN